jgi:nucleoside 2-deoxyribosyltransferase
MPFSPELHYFYLYIKKYIEEVHTIQCERADDQVLTMPILDKINDFIRNADAIITDCSGRNPNGFYELGIAHAQGKKVILITKDPIEEAPSDVRYFEFIKYELDKDTEFFKKLDNALRNVFVEDYEELYNKATEIFKKFKDTAKLNIKMVPKDVFLSRVSATEKTRDLPSLENSWALKEFLLPKIIQNSNDFGVMQEIIRWLSDR